MKLDSFLSSFMSAWKEILIGFISTVLGIAVTIGVDKKLEDDQIEEDKRNLTIMIIHDLDESEQLMREVMEVYREVYESGDYVMKHLDQVYKMPEDTLHNAMIVFSVDMERYRLPFPKMAENVLTNSMSNWTTLSNVKFMRNAEECFSLREMFNQALVEEDYREPIKKKYMEFSAKAQQGIGLDEMRKMVSEFFSTAEVRHYLAEFDFILSQRSLLISKVHQLNSENKWLMSVSNEDIEEYVKASSNRAPAERPQVTTESIVGTWQMDLDHEKGVMRLVKSRFITFNPDYTYMVECMIDAYQTSVDTVYSHTDITYGHWSLEGNEVIRIPDSLQSVPTAKYADDKQYLEYLAEYNEIQTKENVGARLVLSDILISDTEMSAMEYAVGEEDQISLSHYRRK